MSANRTCFIVDGFNLYHSLVDLQKALGKGCPPVKWLDIDKLCRSHISIAGRLSGIPDKAELSLIHYFSASPTHRSQDHVNRHSLYTACLEATGVVVQLGRFKKKDVYCGKCHRYFTAHEEKESDVAIAGKLFEACYSDECDTVVMITGDTDLVPAVKLCKRLFPSKKIIFGFPFQRKNKELEKVADGSFVMKADSIKNAQFPNPFTFSEGVEVEMPTGW